MNPETKEFEEIAQRYLESEELLVEERPETKDWKRFHIGEEIEIKDIMFKIRKITKKDIILRPK
jgi:hypothetical protein